MINRIILLIVISIFSVCVQVNIKMVANQIGGFPNLFSIRPLSSSLLLLCRIAIPSACSMLLILYGYTKMSFVELVLGTTLYYVFIPIANFLFFKQNISARILLADLFIIVGAFLIPMNRI